MKTWSHILGASSRCDLLRVLYYQHSEVGLRQLARLAGVHPHAAERMLMDLVAKGIIVRRKTHARTMFNKNLDHADWCFLKAVFDAADSVVGEQQQARLDKRAQSIMPFMEEAGSMLKQARRSVRVA